MTCPICRKPMAAGGRARRTHCPQGHPYDEANTYVTSRNQRCCRTCGREAKARYKRCKAMAA